MASFTRREALQKIGVGALVLSALPAGSLLQSFETPNDKNDQIKQYSWVRGFNYQPSWGCNGIEIWNNFKKPTFVKEVELGLKHFPKLNALRIWFSYDAFIANRLNFLKAAKEASGILSDRNIKMIPVFFNGWRAIIDFGGFTKDQLTMSKKNGDYAAHRQYLRELLEIIIPSNNILMYDISNEPFNNTGITESTLDFLKSMCFEIKKADSITPVTTGTIGISNGKDLEAVDSFIDVHSIHPYWNMKRFSQEEHLERFTKMVDLIQKLGKPVIATECCWGSNDDQERVNYVRNDLSLLTQAGIGFLPHALHHSLVADLHRPISWRKWDSMYMGFIEPDGSIRKGHQIYNEFC